MATLYTHSQLAAKLIVHGALANMAGTAQQPDVRGVKLDEGRREKLGLAPGGTTLYYEVLEKSGVFVDLSGSTTTIWFRDADGRDGLLSFETMLKRAFPDAKQVDDKANPADETTRLRTYDVLLRPDLVAVVDVAYPAPRAVPRSFFARINAYAPSARPQN
jgi:hypothetical protein